MVRGKGFAVFKPNMPAACARGRFAVKSARKPVVSRQLVSRDWFLASIMARRGLAGATLETACHWAFAMATAQPGYARQCVARHRLGYTGVTFRVRQIQLASALVV